MLSFDEMMGMAAPSQLLRPATPAKSDTSVAAESLTSGYRFVDVLRRATPDGAELPTDGNTLPPQDAEERPAGVSSADDGGPAEEPGTGRTQAAAAPAEPDAGSTRQTNSRALGRPDPLLSRGTSASIEPPPLLGDASESDLEDGVLTPLQPVSVPSGRSVTPELPSSRPQNNVAPAIESRTAEDRPGFESGAGFALGRQTVEEQIAEKTVKASVDLETARRDQTIRPRTLSLDASRIETSSAAGEALRHGEPVRISVSGEPGPSPHLMHSNAVWTPELAARITQPLSEAIAMAMRSRAAPAESSPAQASMIQSEAAQHGASRDALANPAGQLPGASNPALQASVSLLPGAEMQPRETMPIAPVERSSDPASASPILSGKVPGYTGITGEMAPYRTGDGTMPYAAEGGTKPGAAADPDRQLPSGLSAEPVQQSIRSASDPSAAYIVRAYSPAVNAVSPTPAGQRWDAQLTRGSAAGPASAPGVSASVAKLARNIEHQIQPQNPGSSEAAMHDRSGGSTHVVPGSPATGSTSMTVAGQLAPAVGAFSQAQLPAGLMQRLAQASAQGQQSFRVALSPATLGNLDVSIEVRNEQTTVVAVASSQAARDALEASLPRLRQLLAGSDLQLESFTIAHDSSDHRRGFDGERGRSSDTDSSESVAGHGQNQTTEQNEAVSKLDGVDLFA